MRPGPVNDRRALLQRTRRSPIRPRSSSEERSARTVSTAKAAERVRLLLREVDIGELIQEDMCDGKGAREHLRSRGGQSDGWVIGGGWSGGAPGCLPERQPSGWPGDWPGWRLDARQM